MRNIAVRGGEQCRSAGLAGFTDYGFPVTKLVVTAGAIVKGMGSSEVNRVTPQSLDLTMKCREVDGCGPPSEPSTLFLSGAFEMLLNMCDFTPFFVGKESIRQFVRSIGSFAHGHCIVRHSGM